ncbi:SNF2 family N-terminal domain-containing protein [Collybia nuda]|uniref:SNF2 family N-terminal domain-containing protein n=1 Tax=Collybia nuda TaxID=64659 RepID=A0A9P6CIE2_9AGAR|nr:SNF2 family N-terminal domain-containing protein [Collybia nuda]
MPEFHTPITTKRKSDNYDNSSRKRPTLEPEPQALLDEGASSSYFSEEYWMVLWRAPQYKKHKTWDGDAVLVANPTRATLFDSDGKSLGFGKADWPLCEGKELVVGGKEIELERPITKADYISGRCFGQSGDTHSSVPPNKVGLSKKFVPLKVGPTKLLKTPNTTTLGFGSKIPLQSMNLVHVNDNLSAKDQQDIKLDGSHWTANWRKKQTKKHKTWDGDAYVSLTGERLIMMSEEGKYTGSTAWKGETLYSGFTFCISGKEIELDSKVEFSQLPKLVGMSRDLIDSEDVPGFGEVKPSSYGSPNAFRSLSATSPEGAKFIPPTSFYGVPVKSKPKGPLHDPDAEGAVVMKAPTKEHMKKFNKKNLPVVPVVLDPVLARRMRPHQTEGVKFLYESVMGLRKHEGQGCILADEMGLGKTLQTICLVWTLLRQNPYAGASRGVVEKVLVVCPVSLINNWKAEFHKWLGRDRVGVATCDKDKKAALTFMNARNQQVLVIGYERLRTVIKDLAGMIPPIDLIICDEGHRLKSAKNKTSEMFKALRTRRRIILSGTPIQNDLSEFHAMADFCNPGLLDEYGTFRRVYEVPILKSRAPDASEKDAELGEARMAQLLTVAKSFVLRRDATLLGDYLPPKHEYVVFVKPTALQVSIFSKILHPDKLDDLAKSSTAESLALINMLTKVSNSPILLKATADKAKAKDHGSGSFIQKVAMDEALKLLPERAQIGDVSLSGKLTALSELLHMIRSTTEEKCVLVSHYTSTLNILEAYCRQKAYSYYRLDGQTPASKRQEYVNSFNKSSRKSSFIFLLSSKAGGVGINLIGASRLCLVDSDWNPSHDLQSMARCHRDGQKRPVYIYRFLTAGAIDGNLNISNKAYEIQKHTEKIYQRQVTKLGLSNSLMGSDPTSSKSDSFSRKDLRDIFRIHLDSPCNTHDLLECPCEGTRATIIDDATLDASNDECSDQEQGFVKAIDLKPEQIDKVERAYLQKKKAGLAALGEWRHINCLRPSARDDIQDDLLRKLFVPSQPIAKEKPKTQLETLLSGVDLDNVTSMDDVLPLSDVPGGTVSFLFQKSSTTMLELLEKEAESE